MQEQYDYLKSSFWCKEEIIDPYQTIALIFDEANVSIYRNNIKNILRTTHSYRRWKEHPLNNPFFTFEKLELMMNAAYLINKESKHSPLNISMSDIFNPNLYYGWHANYTAWDYFPKMLSFEEYVNPYLTIKRFFNYKNLWDWKKLLKTLSNYALSSQRITNNTDDFDYISIYHYLVKLLEAVHLIDVREVNHIDGMIKNRISKKNNY